MERWRTVASLILPESWQSFASVALPDHYDAILALVVALWVLFVLDLASGRRLADGLALEPRRPARLYGVLTAHFMHGGFFHLLSNTMALLGLGLGAAMTAREDIGALTLFVLLCSGLITWVVARSGPVVGASAIVYGYLGFILAFAWFDRGMVPLVVGVLAFLLYRGIFAGLLPSAGPRFSWEGHLTGFLAGMAAALLKARHFDGAWLFVNDTLSSIWGLWLSLMERY